MGDSHSDYFKDVYEFLNTYQWIFRSSNTRYLVDGIFNKIPEDWVRFIQSLDNHQLNQLANGLQHPNIPSTLDDFLTTLNRLRPSHPVDVTISPVHKFNGISPKKLHEIHKFSTEINQLIVSNDFDNTNTIIVDLGCGLGYLSQLLAQMFGYRVLGLEADAERVAAALRRQTKYFSSSSKLVHYAEHFVDTIQSVEFIKHHVLTQFNVVLSETHIALVGLHACADLTITACRVFNALETASVLAIMPCCYHKMRMKTSPGFENIPLSRCMQESIPSDESWNEVLNRPFLRLACQQTAARWIEMSAEEHAEHGRNMYNRGLVEMVLRKGEHTKCIRNVASPTDGNRVLDGYQLFVNHVPTPWSHEHIQQIQHQFQPNGFFLSEILTGLQAAVQSVCENLVLMDKVCFLQEQIYYDCNTTSRFVGLKKIFQETLSPRCYLLVAINYNKPQYNS